MNKNIEDKTLVILVQNFEEKEGRDRPKKKDLKVMKSPAHGDKFYAVRSLSKDLFWIVDSETGQVSRANPDIGEIVVGDYDVE